MFADAQRHKVIEGTELIAVGTRGLTNLTLNKVYIALYGAEPGIFPNSPYVSVIDDAGKQYSCHLSRFKLKR